MKIAMRCEKCRMIWMQAEEDCMVEIDFYEKKITFICPKCRHENILDVKTWQKNQKHSPLPPIVVT